MEDFRFFRSADNRSAVECVQSIVFHRNPWINGKLIPLHSRVRYLRDGRAELICFLCSYLCGPTALRFLHLSLSNVWLMEEEEKQLHWFSLSVSRAEILPTNVLAVPETKEFLLKVIDVLLDYVRTQNDRSERVLEFHHPEEMLRLLDLDLPDTALPLQQLVQDCATTLKYQVRTGKCNISANKSQNK